MPWYALWSDVIKKKVCRYLLQRYLGQFLQEKLSLEQLNVDLYNGKGTVYDVALYSEALNELCQSQGWALEVIEGYLGSVTVNIPWNALMTEDSYIEVSGLYLALKPKPTAKEGQSVLESMWSSMSSSMQLAQDCMDRDGENLSQNVQMTAMEGIERFAQIIDNVLNRIKVKFVDTVVRLEYVLPNKQRGIAIVVKIKKIEYQNEVGGDGQEGQEGQTNQPSGGQENEGSPSASRKKSYFISTHAIHQIVLEDITFHTEEFLLVDERQTKAQSRASSEPLSEVNEQFHSTISTMSSTMQDSQETFLSEDREEAAAEEDEDNGVRIVSSGEILMGRLRERQEVRIRMKQSENVPGPKVELDLNLGAMEVFLSPRQVHLLLCLSERFTGEGVNAAQMPDCAPKESERDHRQVPVASNVTLSAATQTTTPFTPMSGSVGLHQGWSSNIYDDPAAKSCQQIFYSIAEPSNPIVGGCGNIFDSVMSSSSSMTSSMSSATNCGKRSSGPDADNSLISRFAMRVASILVICLHEDVLFESSLDSPQCRPLTEESVVKMTGMAECVFRKLLEVEYDTEVDGGTDECLNGVLGNHHLRLWLAPVIAEGDEQRNMKENVMQIAVSVARGHLKEVLTDVAVPLLDFHREDTSGLARRPDVVVNVHKLEKIRQRGGAVRFSLPITTINCILAPCNTEIDISIYDRLKAVLDDSPFVHNNEELSQKLDYTTRRSSKEAQNPSTTATLVVASQCADVKLRFPIPDLRPLHDPQRVPWWRRNVRPDFLTFRLHGMKITNVATSGYKMEAREIHIFYCENDRAPSIAIGRCSQRLDADTQLMDIPAVLVEVVPHEEDTLSLLERLERESPTEGAPKKPNPTPFSAKRVCRESDTPHKKSPNDDTETLIIPGDSAEMSTFCEFAHRNSRLRIKINLPLVSLQLRSKHLYEILYNRINSDLLLWEPASNASVPQQTLDNFLNVGMMDSIYAPAASIRAMASDYSATNTSESSGEEDANVFYSMYDRKKNRMPEPVVEGTKSCDVCVHVSITEGLLTMQAPVRDSKNLVIPEQFGEYVIKVDCLSLFTVKGYCGNENLGFVCLEVVDADFYHCGIMPSPNSDPPIRWFDSLLPDYLLRTIYSTPKDLTMQKPRRPKEREMISLAIQIKHCPEQRLKRIRVAAGIEAATLRHNPSQPEHTWLTELIDMFDVVDYPILGYTVSGVVTEMHLHLWDCAIDYRPIYFPYRAVITLGNFMVSSNITTTSPGCTLRFVAEDCTLSLAPQAVEAPPGGAAEDFPKVPENLHGDSRDLVCVVDLGLFEISLRLNEKATSYAPKFDMRAAINDVHIRTCADSARALAQLISYIAAKGDLESNGPEETCDSTGNLGEADADLLSVRSSQVSIPEVTHTQQQHVNTLMAEAMQESAIEESDYSDDEIGAMGPGVDVFFFPDEAAKMGISSKQSQKGSTPDSVSITSSDLRELYDFESSVMGGGQQEQQIDIEVEEALPQVAKDLGSVRRREVATPSKGHQRHIRNVSSGTDDDFCFISEEERVIFGGGQSEVAVTEDPIRIVDNHFSVPNRKPDLLQAPHDFPMAVIRYTLCEMSITWHIFGGSDFGSAPQVVVKKDDSLLEDESYRLSYHLPMSDVYKYGVSYAAGAKNVADARRHQPTGGKLSWKTRGGINRRHDILMEFQLNKVRFSHEVYPSDREQASRQVLLVSDMEIKDKLAVSNINKFLYHPTSGTIKPQQSRANLIVIKALHLRSDLSLPAQECCLRVSMLPLRLNIDQDSLLFLFDFFQEFSGGDTPSNQEIVAQRQVPPSMSPPPIMMVDLPEAAQELQARKMVSENLMLLMEDEGEKATTPTAADTEDNSPIYFRSISFSPEVKIRIDYQGKRVELSRGPLAGLLMGLGQLHCSEIRLKRICHKNGILGVDKLLNFLLQEWLQDIKRNQLPSLLGGVGPMHSFIQLFQGIRDLFWLPIEQYQKDGQIVRGLQRGAQSFTARTALAALEITTRLIHLLQITAETAYDMVSPGPSVRRVRGYKKGKRKRVQPPQDIREGVANAYQIVRDGIGETVHTIMEVAALEHDQKGYTGAVGAVVREIPSTMVKPIVLATQATTNVLGGVRNQLVPDARIEAREKWKDDED
uniref:Autophagy-related protein 2 n=1 Tax=Lutzomyia longipalpis TaxID=7200 RepID=A0A7G3AGM6_LUTLO